MRNHAGTAIPPRIAPLIYCIRGQRVILDGDLAKIYGVETRTLNQAIRRNKNRFPQDFMFSLTETESAELHRLRSQSVILKPGRGQHRKYPPLAFTEHGALMAATVLKSSRAVAMCLYVMRAFVQMREDLVANAAILKRLAEIDNSLLLHDEALRDIYHKLHPLLEPQPLPLKPEIGFHVKEDAVPYRIRKKQR